MAIERKFVSLVNFKQSSEGAGGLEGYASVFNEIDEGGDLILAGAFSDTIQSFLQKGFTAHSHDWSVNGAVGYPMEAREDGHGLYVVSKFHSTPDAQMVRTKAAERLADGKQVGLSIGFSHAAAPTFIYPAQYRSELTKYCKADRLEANLAKAQRFQKIRVLSKANLYEYSIVTAPMNQLAQATSVKSIETKGEYLGDWIESSMTMAAAGRAIDAFWWFVADVIYDTDSPLEERLSKVQGAAGEMTSLVVKVIAAIMAGESDETPEEAVKAIKSFYPDPSKHETGSRAGLVLSKHSEDAIEPQQKATSADETARLYAEFVYLGAQLDGAIGA